MKKLDLLIADGDSPYVEALTAYWERRHSWLHVVPFTHKDSLTRFISGGGQGAMLLIGHDMIPSHLPEGILTVAWGGVECDTPGGIPRVSKYQSADDLLHQLMMILNRTNPNHRFFCGSEQTAGLYAVTSAAGGSGKSLVAAALAITLARTGLKTFYLNLETVATTPLFFRSEEGYGLSEVLLFMDQPQLLPSVVMRALRTDPRCKVDFFPAPEMGGEISEMTGENIKAVLETLRGSGCYQAIVIDTDAGLNTAARSVLECVSAALALTTPDFMHQQRLVSYRRDVQKICSDLNMIEGVNRWTAGSPGTEDAAFTIPLMREAVSRSHSGRTAEVNPEFMDHVQRIIPLLQMKTAGERYEC